MACRQQAWAAQKACWTLKILKDPGMHARAGGCMLRQRGQNLTGKPALLAQPLKEPAPLERQGPAGQD